MAADQRGGPVWHLTGWPSGLLATAAGSPVSRGPSGAGLLRDRHPVELGAEAPVGDQLPRRVLLRPPLQAEQVLDPGVADAFLVGHGLADLVEHPASDREVVLGQGTQVDLNVIYGEGEYQARGREPRVPLAQELRVAGEDGHQAASALHRVPDPQIEIGGFQVQPRAEGADIAWLASGPLLDKTGRFF